MADETNTIPEVPPSGSGAAPSAIVDRLTAECAEAVGARANQSQSSADGDNEFTANPGADTKRHYVHELQQARILNLVTLLSVVFAAVAAYMLWRANVESDKAFMQGHRAYVFLKEPVTFGVREPGTNTFKLWRTSLVLENTGDTPTRGLAVQAFGLEVHKGSKFNLFTSPPSHPNLASPISYAVVPPHGTVTVSFGDLPDAVVDSVGRGDFRYLLYGSIEYNDAFDKTCRHRVRFVREIIKSDDAQPPVQFYLPLEYNDPDETCTDDARSANSVQTASETR